MEKDLNYLNSKWWYRLIKVVYFFLFLIILITPLVEIVEDNLSKYDNKNSYIKCANNKIFFLEENNFPSDGFVSIEKVESLCFDGVKKIINNKSNFLDGFQTYEEQIISQTENSGKYTLVSVYTNIKWFKIFYLSFFSSITIIAFFELVRRLFYYIFLGSFLPEKPKKYLFFNINYKD